MVRWAAILLLPIAAACGRDSGPAAPPPLEVSVAAVATAKIPVFVEHVGTTEAVNTVEVRARVRGVLERVLFKEGADVKQGDLLFVIEQAPYRAALAKAKGDLAGALASLERLFQENPGKIAAIFLEPEKDKEPSNGFLREAQRLCKQNGTVFVLDEMITGFRWHLNGAQAM